MSRQQLLLSFILSFVSSLNFSNNASEHLYSLLLPKLVNFNIEEPSQEDVHFINICHAHNQGGTHFELPNKELWQAVSSIDLFDITKQYMPTITASGRIALARQYAQMNDNATTIQNKIELQRYLQQNPGLQRKLEKLITHAQPAEETFAKLFKVISEEEQLEIDRVNAQLYFSWFTAFNENEWALGAGPRLNQMHTTAWYTIPPVIASTLHRTITHKLAYDSLVTEQDVIANIKIAGGTKQYQEKLEQKIQEYRADEKEEKTYYWGDKYYPDNSYQIGKAQEKLNIATKYTSTTADEFTAIATKLEKQRLDHIADASHIKLLEALKKDIKQKKSAELTCQEKGILETNAQGFVPEYNVAYSLRSPQDLPSAAKIFAQDGIKNLPSFTFDATKQTGKALYQEAKERKMYQFWRKEYPNSQAKAVAMTLGGYAYITCLASIYPGILLWRYASTKKLFDLIYDKQQELLSIAHLVKSMHQAYSIIDQDPTLREVLCTEHQIFASLFNPKSTTTSADLKHLIQQLLSSSFQGEASYFLSQPGKILATHQLLVRIKNELVPFLEALGNIDAYISIQKLYLEYQDHPRVTFCLPELIDAPTPILNISEYWHPLINPNFVVTNSLTIGNNDIQNLMITGPNAGGKTTSLMSLIINIIFAQSFGIAPSKSLTFTPFAKIHSYLDITTNLQEGLSLFAAEVDRAKKLKQSILSCTPGQKTFTIIDEIFSGTNPQVASDVGFKFAAQLGEMTHSLTIITTHFPRLTDLEKEVGTFTNYKVADAAIMPDGKVVYPFKLIAGVSNQNIAQHMLEQQGII